MAFHYEKLKVLRKAKHMSQMELAKTLGVGKSTIGMYESGQRTPEFKTLEAICDFFNISMTELSDNLSTNGRSNINITTNNGAVSGSGNATVIECPLTDDKLEVSLRAMLGDSVETDDIVQALTDGVTVLKDLDDFDRQNLRLYLQGIVNVIKKAKANGDKYKPRSKL